MFEFFCNWAFILKTKEKKTLQPKKALVFVFTGLTQCHIMEKHIIGNLVGLQRELVITRSLWVEEPELHHRRARTTIRSSE